MPSVIHSFFYRSYPIYRDTHLLLSFLCLLSFLFFTVEILRNLSRWSRYYVTYTISSYVRNGLRTGPRLIGLPCPENTDAAWFHSVGWLLPELLHSIIKIKATFCFCSPMAAPFLFLHPRDQDYSDRSYRHLTSFFRRAYSPLSLHTLLLIASRSCVDIEAPFSFCLVCLSPQT